MVGGSDKNLFRVYLVWLKMYFKAGLPSFYEPCSKKNWTQYLGAHTNSIVQIYLCYSSAKLQQPCYYDFSTLTFSSYTKDLNGKTFGWNFSNWPGKYILNPRLSLISQRKSDVISWV